MRVEIWSDVVCPWCYVGKRRFEAALARFENAAEVDVVWRSFELDPSAPKQREGSYPVRLAEKYGTSVEQAEEMIDRMVQAGRRDGLSMRFDIALPGNTLDAHRLLHHAREAGLQYQLKERLLAAVFTNGEAIADPRTLSRRASDAGLDAADVERVLSTGTYTKEVRADEREAMRQQRPLLRLRPPLWAGRRPAGRCPARCAPPDMDGLTDRGSRTGRGNGEGAGLPGRCLRRLILRYAPPVREAR